MKQDSLTQLQEVTVIIAFYSSHGSLCGDPPQWIGVLTEQTSLASRCLRVITVKTGLGKTLLHSSTPEKPYFRLCHRLNFTTDITTNAYSLVPLNWVHSQDLYLYLCLQWMVWNRIIPKMPCKGQTAHAHGASCSHKGTEGQFSSGILCAKRRGSLSNKGDNAVLTSLPFIMSPSGSQCVRGNPPTLPFYSV